MRECKCPNCSANITIQDDNRDFAFCEYCGTKILLDDYRSSHRIIDEARIKQAENERIIKLKQLELEEQRLNHSFRVRKPLFIIWLIATVIVAVFCIISFAKDGVEGIIPLFYLGVPVIGGGGYFIFKFLPDKEEERTMVSSGYGVRFPKGLEPFEENTFEEVQKALMIAGFTNVSGVNKHDIKIGLLKKTNSIECITVNGKKIEEGGKIYNRDAVILITYHGK